MRTAIVPAQAAHVAAIAAAVRAQDAAELAAGWNATPEQCMHYGLRFVAFTGLVDDAPVCMFGVTPFSVLAREGVPWMVGTVALEQLSVEKALLRHARGEFAHLRAGYARLFNVVDDANAAGKRWLAWLGFQMGEPFPFGRGTFRCFEWRADGHYPAA